MVGKGVRQPEKGKDISGCFEGFLLGCWIGSLKRGADGFQAAFGLGLILLAVIGLIIFQRVKLGFHGGIFAREFFHG